MERRGKVCEGGLMGKDKKERREEKEAGDMWEGEIREN